MVKRFSGKRWRYFVQDESRFGRITNTGKSWVPAPLRGIVAKQIVREYSYLYMAACVETGASTSFILPYLNHKCMEIFLQQMHYDFPDEEIVLQVDGAACHSTKKLKIPDNIHLIFQPPYSPELNPMEAIWDYIKENFFRNRYFESMDALHDYLCKVINTFQGQKQRIKSIIQYPFIKKVYSNAI